MAGLVGVLTAMLGCGVVGGGPGAHPAGHSGPVVVKPAERHPRFAHARCNDGTPFAYTIRRGSSDTWVVNLQGGFFCDDEQARCADRKRRLTTTVPEADGAVTTMKHQGLFAPDPGANPTFAAATMVDAHYCSSDLWLGLSSDRRPTTGAPEGWYFSGRRNVRALFDSLIEHQGLDGSVPDTRLLLVGTSAGGAGVVGSLDWIRERLPELATSGRLKVVLDGSWVPAPPAGVALPRANAWGPVHEACDAALRARGEDPVRCILGREWWPWVARNGVPVLVQLSGLDRSQTPVFGISGAAAEAAWQQRVRESLQPVPWVFSGGHSYHVVAFGPRFGKGPPGRRFRDVLDRFWRTAPSRPGPTARGEQVFFRYPAAENSVNGSTPGK